jgi:predicted PurR-regulated permease PerM
MESTDKDAKIERSEELAPVFGHPDDPKTTAGKNNDSPPWGWGTKLIVGILLVGGFLALVFHFNEYFKLVLTAFLLSFLLYPICDLLRKVARVSWRFSVMTVYLVLAGLLVWLIARGGTSLASQVQNLFQTVIDNVDNITILLEKWSSQTILIGPFQFTTPQLDFALLGTWISEALQPIASQAGTIATTVVGKVGGFLVNLGITYMVSFFITSETEGARRRMINISIPGYEKDFRRLGLEVGKIFNSFIRGEFTVVSIAIIVYTVFLGILGLPYFFILALIAGFGRFIPYVGAILGWVSFFIGALIQDPTPFGMTNILYALLIVGIAVVIDTIFDQVLMPKVMGNSLKVHPAAILISALVGSQLLGVLGVILAAPAFATLKLILRYSSRKLFDQDPWEGMQYYQKPNETVLMKGLRKTWAKISTFLEKPWYKVKHWFKKQFRRFKNKAEKGKS